MFRRNARITTTTIEAPVSDSPSDIDKLSLASREALTSLVAAVGPALAEAREKLGPAVEDARVKIGPAVEDARVRFAPVVSDARGRLGPLAESALIASRMQGHKAALRLGLVEEPQPEPESHKLRNLVMVLGLGGAAAMAYKMMTGKDADPAWTASRDSAAASHADYGYDSADSSGTQSEWSSDETHSTPESGSLDSTAHLAAAGAPPLSTDVPGDESDTAPSAPFASAETVESHVPTTPDEPLERKNL